jgi:hypothetical protein
LCGFRFQLEMKCQRPVLGDRMKTQLLLLLSSLFTDQFSTGISRL